MIPQAIIICIHLIILNTRALLVSKIFSGDNYVAQSRSITIALIVKNKVAFINGSLPQPSPVNVRLKTARLRANNLMLFWLMNSIAKEIRGSLLYFNNVADIQNELKIRYLRRDSPRVFALEKSLSSISQGSNSIIEYFNAFKALWDEYVSYCPLTSCNCGFMEKCICAMLKNLANQQEVNYVMKFLIGLHDSFSSNLKPTIASFSITINGQGFLFIDARRNPTFFN